MSHEAVADVYGRANKRLLGRQDFFDSVDKFASRLGILGTRKYREQVTVIDAHWRTLAGRIC